MSGLSMALRWRIDQGQVFFGAESVGKLLDEFEALEAELGARRGTCCEAIWTEIDDHLERDSRSRIHAITQIVRLCERCQERFVEQIRQSGRITTVGCS